MKKILITGKNSYIGNKFEEWLNQSENNKYEVSKISVRDDQWKSTDFSRYDSVVHLAGIAHVSRNPRIEELYYQVNRDLTIEVAEKAKFDGVNHFVFMSSIIVYGDSGLEEGTIKECTIPNPVDFYGKSKLQAEDGLMRLEDERFNVAIIRPPMIYGPNSKGNYPKLSKLAKITPLFPDINNKRSMIFIDNLSEFMRLLIKNEEKGIYYPQNKNFIKTSDLVRQISVIHNKKVKLVSFLNPLIYWLQKRSNIVNKVFGNLIYESGLSEYKEEYRVVNFEESIKRTEK